MHPLERRARKQERVLPVPGTIVGQILQPHDLIEDHAKVAQERTMEDAQAADFLIVALFASHIVGADRDYLHFVKPFYEFLAVLEPRLVELTVGKKRVDPLLVLSIEPAGVQHEDVVLLDRTALLLCSSEKVLEGYAFTAI